MKRKKIRKWGRGFSTQKEAKYAYDEYMNDFSKTAIRQNSTMTYKNFLEEYFYQIINKRVESEPMIIGFLLWINIYLIFIDTNYLILVHLL